MFPILLGVVACFRSNHVAGWRSGAEVRTLAVSGPVRGQGSVLGPGPAQVSVLGPGPAPVLVEVAAGPWWVVAPPGPDLHAGHAVHRGPFPLVYSLPRSSYDRR